MNVPKYKFFSAWYCPFAQRTWMALEEAGLSYEYTEIDPYKKTIEWLQISRGTGQVPVLEVESSDMFFRIPDSVTNIEFLDDLNTDFKPLGQNKFERSEQRYWINFLGKNVIPYFYRLLKSEKTDHKEPSPKQHMMDNLALWTQAMSDEGPFFAGKNITAVDIIMALFGHRIELLLSHYRQFELPTSGLVWGRYHRWLDAVQKRPSFPATRPGNDYEERLVNFYLPYSLGGGQDDVTNLS